MILILGNNRDDILYFETRIADKKEETILNKYQIVTGTISSQSVVLVKDVYTNIIASAVVSYIIEKFYILFVIKVGKCITLSKQIKNGDIAISKRVVAGDVDVCDIQGTKLGQIPGLSQTYDISSENLSLIRNSFLKCTYAQIFDCSVISSNTHYTSEKQLEHVTQNNKIMNEKIDDVVFDSESYGVAIACELYQVPFVSVNVVGAHVGEEFTTSHYIKVLKQYSNIGKAITNMLCEIGSNEVIRG